MLRSPTDRGLTRTRVWPGATDGLWPGPHPFLRVGPRSTVAGPGPEHRATVPNTHQEELFLPAPEGGGRPWLSRAADRTSTTVGVTSPPEAALLHPFEHADAVLTDDSSEPRAARSATEEEDAHQDERAGSAILRARAAMPCPTCAPEVERPVVRPAGHDERTAESRAVEGPKSRPSLPWQRRALSGKGRGAASRGRGASARKDVLHGPRLMIRGPCSAPRRKLSVLSVESLAPNFPAEVTP
jgi:hypothetical protein